MPGRTLSYGEVLDLLRAAPPRIAAATEGWTPEELHARPGGDEWSAAEVLAHLRACADVWGACIRTILEQDAVTLRAVNPRTWIEGTDYRDVAFGPALRAFTDQRAELLAVLGPLPPEGWAREVTVTGAGRPLRRTVLSYAQWLAEHERPHVRQIARLAPTGGAGS